MRGSNQSGMRQFNERIVLQAIRHHGAMPKADLARLTQLSSQTVANVVGRLLDEGLLLKQDRVRGRIGQPSVPLALDPEGAFSVGIQVGRRNLELLVADFCGTPVCRREFQYAYPDPDGLFELMASGLAALQLELGPRWQRVVGVGLTAPLSLHLWAELMGGEAAVALRRWESIDMQARVQQLVAQPVVFAKDTTAACVAELLQGRGRSVRSFLYIFVGTFVGGSLVIDGHIAMGERGNAGAIGSLPIGLPLAGRKPPQLLQLASGWQLEQALINHGQDPHIVQQPEIMSDAYRPLTQAWLQQASSGLAMTATAAAAMLDVEAVVMDGSLEPSLLAALTAATREAMDGFQFDGMVPPRLVTGEVGSHARALGGALLPLHSQFFPDKDIFLKQDERR